GRIRGLGHRAKGRIVGTLLSPHRARLSARLGYESWRQTGREVVPRVTRPFRLRPPLQVHGHHAARGARTSRLLSVTAAAPVFPGRAGGDRPQSPRREVAL